VIFLGVQLTSGAIKGLRQLGMKFLATLNENNEPNVVPILSIDAYDKETLIFGHMMMNKTRMNLDKNEKTTAGCYLLGDFNFWQMKGDFKGFSTKKDKKYGIINSFNMYRFNAYLDLSPIGTIKLKKTYHTPILNKSVIFDICRPKKSRRKIKLKQGSGIKVPLPVLSEYDNLLGFKVVAFLDNDGYPFVFPSLSLVPLNSSQLVFRNSYFKDKIAQLKPGTKVATSVLGMVIRDLILILDQKAFAGLEPLAYQAKGVFKGWKKGYGIINITEVYSACPPLPGNKII